VLFTDITVQRKKPIILALVHYYLPGYKSGGPVRTIVNMVDHLSDYFDFRIVTSDRDALDEAPYAGVAIDSWNTVGKAQVYYLSPSNRSMRALARIVSDMPYDVLYLNSFFDLVFTQRPLLARRLGLLPNKPVVIAPRGEFSPGALAIKHWKKAPYKWFASALGLYQDLTWQASSEHEWEDIRRAMGAIAQQIFVAPNLPSVSQGEVLEHSEPTSQNGDPLRIIFLSRISPMKNLDFALRVLVRLKVPVHFDIYGPVGSEPYWRQCRALMAEAPPNVSVRYCGAVDHSQVSRILGAYDLFFLPTRGENYGHVIMESLTAGTPVLIADTTPWRHLERDGVGWDLPLDDEQQFADRIHDAAQLSNEAFGLWRKRVRCYARDRLDKSEEIVANRRLFIEAAGKGAPAN
jgi:glycosyltransferase involved in cell wall biosynthesis